MPVRFTDCGLALAELGTDSTPVKVPVVPGVKVSPNVQVVPGCNVEPLPPQLLDEIA